MKKTLVSLATASLIASTAMAADKGIDIVTTGQAVLYYQTASNNGDNNDAYGEDTQLFSKGSSRANVGVQLNLDADLKNNFTFGSQLSYIGTAGLEGNLVSNVMQSTGPGGATANNDLTDEIALTKFFIAKKIGNSTVKVGRQELPKSLSPFAYSEGWNVFKNTFEAVLAINTDIPDTTVVGAYVTKGNANGDLGNFNNLTNGTGLTANSTTGGVYMLTVQNKSIPMTTATVSYYDISKAVLNAGGRFDGVSVVWADVAVADKSLPMGLKAGLQGGKVMTDTTSAIAAFNYADTSAFGIRVGASPIENLNVCAAFTSVDGDDNKQNISINNMATGIKTPLYTQMVGNQNDIKLDSNTFMLKAAYNTGDYGTVIAQGTMSSVGESNLGAHLDSAGNVKGSDIIDLELVYKVKAAGVNFLAAYVHREWEKNSGAAAAADASDLIRVWARYNF